MHLQRVGFGFGWLYSFHGHSVFGFPSASSSLFFFFFLVPRLCARRTPKRILVLAPLISIALISFPSWGVYSIFGVGCQPVVD
jgi:hypothetical protein